MRIHNIKQNIILYFYRTIEKICPYTVLTTSNFCVAVPKYIKPILEIRTKTKRIVIAKKIKNIYDYKFIS